MNSNEVTEVRFTAKRACYWNNGNRRWQAIGADKARALVALGMAEDVTEAHTALHTPLALGR